MVAPELPRTFLPPWLARALLVVLATVGFALLAGEAFRPRVGYVSDFTQDWLSARDVLEGRPAYGDLPDALRRHMNGEPPQDFLRWNAHPPGSVLVVLPLARLDHSDAFFAWNLLTFPLFVVAIGLVLRALGGDSLRRDAIAAVLIAVAGVTCYPLYHQVLMGQFNALLAFLLALAWFADRSGRGTLAGVAVGVAAAVKLFPAFLLLYFVAARRWRAAGVAAGTALALTALAVGVLGVDAFRTYAREVVPAISAKYATQWNNITIRAFWLRLFDPTDESRVVALATMPAVGHALAAVSRFAVVVAVGVVAWGAARGSVAARDLAFAAAVAGMILVSPIAWPHYLIMLVVPVGVLAAHLARTPWRWALAACVAVLWLPETFVPGVAFGSEYAKDMINHQHEPLGPAANVFVSSVQHHALAGMFLLCFCRRPGPDAPG